MRVQIAGALFALVMFAPTLSAQFVGTLQIIPQIADGSDASGNFYTTYFFIDSQSSALTTCTLGLSGVPASRFPTTSITGLQGASGYVLSSFGKTGPLATGYATILCDAPVSVNTLYVYTNGSNQAIQSWATVFSQATFSSGSVTGIMSLPTYRIGLAIANDTGQTANLTIQVNIRGTILQTTFALPAQTSISRFVDEIVSGLTSGLSYPVVTISSDQPISATGLLYNGALFTTIPITIYH